MTAKSLTEASKGCLMLFLKPVDGHKIVRWARENIPEHVLAADGFDECPHITVLYGFAQSVTPQRIAGVLQRYKLKELYAALGPVSMFRNETDVVKISAHGSDLEQLHWVLREDFEGEVECTYPDYKGHLTLAYVMPGSCDHIEHHAKFNGNVYVFDSVVYSLPGSTQQWTIKLDGSTCALNEAVRRAGAAEHLYAGKFTLDDLVQIVHKETSVDAARLKPEMLEAGETALEAFAEKMAERHTSPVIWSFVVDHIDYEVVDDED